ncbi:hypothetical protein BD414DRAFT_483699 [Trametes punicea]|nr:hypothetical protein BD414DRAFT_483699 [Trametes punicea]
MPHVPPDLKRSFQPRLSWRQRTRRALRRPGANLPTCGGIAPSAERPWRPSIASEPSHSSSIPMNAWRRLCAAPFRAPCPFFSGRPFSCVWEPSSFSSRPFVHSSASYGNRTPIQCVPGLVMSCHHLSIRLPLNIESENNADASCTFRAWFSAADVRPRGFRDAPAAFCGRSAAFET